MKTAFVLSALLAAASLSACDSSLPVHRTQVAARARDAGSAAPARVGREVFRMNCQGCHGAGAAGSARGPALTKMGTALAAGAGDGIVRARLAGGGQEMPPFTHLSRPEVDAVIGFLVELGGGRARPEARVAPLAGAALGEHLYRSNCAGCHGDERTVTTGISCRPANLAGATQRFTKQQVMNLLNVGTGPMPAFAHLKDSERDAIWTYLDTLDAGPNAPTGASCGMVRAAMEGR
ncbi:MAG: c-type cytochrome, partial [Deltaproteobacteria bacterium]|nr:c-type cytochrome [Deltaproteobacteria bacterium]